MDCFKNKQIIINKILVNYLITIKNNKLRKIIDYSFYGGKRLRPMIILVLCNKFNIEYRIRNKLIIGIELLHNASLIMDDMPDMDNDNFRRNRFSIHKKYGMSTAKIISNYMLNEGMSNFTFYLKKDILIRINKFINEKNKDICLGQYYDLNFNNLEDLKNIDNTTKLYYLNLKTIPLFSICFVVPYIISKDLYNSIIYNDLELLSIHFSYMFQICDDYEDLESDKINNANNHILIFGSKLTYEMYLDSENTYKKLIEKCRIQDSFFDNLLNYLNNKIKINIKK